MNGELYTACGYKCSAGALRRLHRMEVLIQRDPGARGIEHLHIPGELARAVSVLSRSRHVGIVTGFPVFDDKSPPAETGMCVCFCYLPATVCVLVSLLHSLSLLCPSDLLFFVELTLSLFYMNYEIQLCFII